MTGIKDISTFRKLLLVAGLFMAIVLLFVTGWRHSVISVVPSLVETQFTKSSKSAMLTRPATDTENMVGTQIESVPTPSFDNPSLEWTDSVEQKQEFEAWTSSRGYVSTPWTGDSYDAYDDATLQMLAEKNQDLKAMIFLGIRASGEERIKWLNRAAVYGSSYALLWAGSGYAALHPTESEQVKKANLIKALAYKKVLELRNDFYSSRGINIKLYESKLGISLSDHDKALAEQKAQTLYSELESQRIQLGLGKFDNSVPPAVEAYYQKFVF
ncbi:MAG TPA: hypothetical protein VL995_13410 [Cellvibrio sp.]|nr:hypothetical protein [Cellvibrio sp.]